MDRVQIFSTFRSFRLKHIRNGRSDAQELAVKQASVEERSAEIARLHQRVEERDSEITRLVSKALANSDAMANLKYELWLEQLRSHEWWLNSETQRKRIQDLYRSRSWKLTGPYRRIGRILKRATAGAGFHNFRTTRDSLAISAIKFVILRPRLKSFLSQQIRRYPPLFNCFRDFTIAKILLENRSRNTFFPSPNSSKHHSSPLQGQFSCRQTDLRFFRDQQDFLDLEQFSKRRRET